MIFETKDELRMFKKIRQLMVDSQKAFESIYNEADHALTTASENDAVRIQVIRRIAKNMAARFTEKHHVDSLPKPKRGKR